jgi:flagellar hook-basal body complex protein FliE
MTVIPSAATAAYQAIAKIGADVSASPGVASAKVPGTDFSQFLNDAVKDSVGAMKSGEVAAMQQTAGQADVVNVVTAVNNAELTLDTVVAVRDKVIGAYQDIMKMPI